MRACASSSGDAGARTVQLSKSYRSVPNIQRAVNAAFRPVMDGSPERLQAGYVPLEPSRGEYEGQPSVVALPVPEPYSQRYVTGRRIEQCLPDAVGAYVQWLVEQSGWAVTERRKSARPCRSKRGTSASSFADS